MRKIVLASGSPRRKMLLEQIGLKFIVEISNFDEDQIKSKSLTKLVEKLSLEKAKKVASKYPDAIIISADTVVAYKEKAFSKPENAEKAKVMLMLLSGKTHSVITGFTILDTKSNSSVTKSVTTKVYMKKLSAKEIDAYIKTGEPLDKAGAYGIQEKGAVFIKKIEGDYNNVVGLPIFSLVQELREFGIEVLRN